MNNYNSTMKENNVAIMSISTYNRTVVFNPQIIKMHIDKMRGNNGNNKYVYNILFNVFRVTSIF